MVNFDNRPIGVFDSGLGGLTVVTCLQKILPNERYIYFGDTARTPYGTKSKETIIDFSKQITDFLAENDVKLIVIACNTVSAIALEALKERHPDIPIIGMIVPTAKFLAKEFKNSEGLGIIGTRVTVESNEYEKKIIEYGGNTKVFSKACPLFVPTIEEGIFKENVLNPIIKYYLDDFIAENKIQVLVLGCTHYPLIINEISELYPDLIIANPSKIVAYSVKNILVNMNMCAERNSGESVFYASDLSKEFIRMAQEICSKNNLKIKNFIF